MDDINVSLLPVSDRTTPASAEICASFRLYQRLKNIGHKIITVFETYRHTH